MDAGMREMLDDLEAEQVALQSVLRDIDDDDWLRPTPARFWDVRDTVSHLADIDEVAADTATDGPRSLAYEVGKYASSEDFTMYGCLRGRKLSGPQVLAWWEEAAELIRRVLGECDPQQRVPWGIGMSARSLVTARLMETWAHALDVHAALGVEPDDTDRLRHVAWIGYRALPYAYSVKGRTPPPGELRVELDPPSGGPAWTFGPADAPNRITGPASQFCRVFVQRLTPAEATALVAEGEAAVAALDVARAYL
jgi:uncharacterized protein (TIGR03084 family)